MSPKVTMTETNCDKFTPFNINSRWLVNMYIQCLQRLHSVKDDVVEGTLLYKSDIQNKTRVAYYLSTCIWLPPSILKQLAGSSVVVKLQWQTAGELSESLYETFNNSTFISLFYAYHRNRSQCDVSLGSAELSMVSLVRYQNFITHHLQESHVKNITNMLS